jgi:ABC-2 type transport system permease protein
MLVFWSAVAREGAIAGFDQERFAAYFFAAAAVRMLTAMWLAYEVNTEVRQGVIAKRLLRPIHPFVIYAGEVLSSLPVRSLVLIPIALGAAVFVGRDQLARDPWLWLMAPAAIAGAWLITFAASLLIGSLCLVWDSSIAIWDLWLGLSALFSGYLLPLALLPRWLGSRLEWTPFPYLLSLPVELLLGMVTRRQAFVELSLQWGYVALFLGAALLAWNRCVPRYEAYSG